MKDLNAHYKLKHEWFSNLLMNYFDNSCKFCVLTVDIKKNTKCGILL